MDNDKISDIVDKQNSLRLEIITVKENTSQGQKRLHQIDDELCELNKQLIE